MRDPISNFKVPICLNFNYQAKNVKQKFFQQSCFQDTEILELERRNYFSPSLSPETCQLPGCPIDVR